MSSVIEFGYVARLLHASINTPPPAGSKVGCDSPCSPNSVLYFYPVLDGTDGIGEVAGSFTKNSPKVIYGQKNSGAPVHHCKLTMNQPTQQKSSPIEQILEPLRLTPLRLSPVMGPDTLRLASGKMDEAASEEAALLWDHLTRKLGAWGVTADGSTYLLLQLDPEVVTEIDHAWATSPSRGWLLHCLAGEILMAACRECVPEIASTGCAPLPPVGPELRAVLTEAGLPPRDDNTLSQPLALLTYLPYQGSCGLCSLVAQCPGPREEMRLSSSCS
jgi:hypothetical protein